MSVSRPRRVLWVMREYRRQLDTSIRDFATASGWQLDRCPRLPPGWYGDGIIMDRLHPEELTELPAGVPVVTRSQVVGEHIRNVCGNTAGIAALTAAYFLERGFVNFAAFEKRNYRQAALRAPFIHPNPEQALKTELARHGHELHLLYWQDQLAQAEQDNFRAAIGVFRSFLRDLPKPCAVFCPNLDYLTYFYRACEEEDIAIPQELALLVINDDPEINLRTLPTTSAIAGEINNVGLKLGALLQRLMDGEPVPPEPVVVEPSHIVTRQSTDILAVPHLPTANAINFLLRNYSSRISIKDAAEAAKLPVSTMKYLFRKYLDTTPGELLHRTRMNRIRELLLHSDMTLEEIAMQTGYGSAMALSLAFRGAHGETPGRYRSARRCIES